MPPEKLVRPSQTNSGKNAPFPDCKKMAAPQGFEPQLNEPESLVLPLHHGAASNCGFLSATLFNIVGHCRNASSKYKISGFFSFFVPLPASIRTAFFFPSLGAVRKRSFFPAAGRKKVAIHFIRNYCIRKRFYLHRFRRRCRSRAAQPRKVLETAHLFARCRGNDVRVLFVYNAMGDEHLPFGS